MNSVPKINTEAEPLHHAPPGSHITVGMSGGVDSSVASALLQQQGYAVDGLFMKNWEEDDTSTHCSAEEDLADARAVSDQLGITLRSMNFSSEYWDRVFAYFLDAYRSGYTPNPDVLCNKEVKFRCFLEHALDSGADFIATGHYARIVRRDNRFHLYKGKDTTKDQSYFLYTLNQDQLSHSLFPLGELDKAGVREIAARVGLTNYDKKDSTGICFIGERNFREFLQHYLPASPGPMCTADGKEIGQHDGLMYYTLGQRQGLGIGGKQGCDESPWYVVGKNLANNTLLVAQGHDHPLLFSSWLQARELHWVSGTPPVLPLRCTAKTRYRQTDVECCIEQLTDDQARVSFVTPQRAVTPGQSVVFYAGEECLGGGVIYATEQMPQGVK